MYCNCTNMIDECIWLFHTFSMLSLAGNRAFPFQFLSTILTFRGNAWSFFGLCLKWMFQMVSYQNSFRVNNALYVLTRQYAIPPIPRSALRICSDYSSTGMIISGMDEELLKPLCHEEDCTYIHSFFWLSSKVDNQSHHWNSCVAVFFKLFLVRSDPVTYRGKKVIHHTDRRNGFRTEWSSDWLQSNQIKKTGRTKVRLDAFWYHWWSEFLTVNWWKEFEYKNLQRARTGSRSTPWLPTLTAPWSTDPRRKKVTIFELITWVRAWCAFIPPERSAQNAFGEV